MTDTAIINAALRRIGLTGLESDLRTDTTRAGIAARDIYDERRKELLARHTWKFAKKRVQLTVSATTPAFGRQFAYPLPDDFIRLVSVHPTSDDESVCAYKLEATDEDDRVVLTDQAACYIVYIFDQQNTEVMSATFRRCLVYACAMDLAPALNRPDSIEQFSEVGLRRLLGEAKAIDGMEDYPDRMAEGSWSTQRDGDYDQSAGS